MPADREPTRASFALDGESDEFARTLAAFEEGRISADEWRAFRLSRGSYPQRQAAEASMLRVKIPQGVLDSRQLRALAEVAVRWSRGFGHVTTRQNVQFHFVRQGDVPEAMARLADAGLTTREACGNTVRNVTACPYAGIAVDEPFDVTPYAEALTRHLLRHPLGSALPRKFKIAFEGCGRDHAFAAINDIGWYARLRGGQRGFRVVVGGGTATLCRPAAELLEFVPARDTLRVAEAVLRVYRRLGDYEHRSRNRLKYLIRSLGWDAWRAEVLRELETVGAEGGTDLLVTEDRTAVAETEAARSAAEPPLGQPLPAEPPGLADWRSTNVRPQRQAGYEAVTVTLPLGDVTARQLGALADLVVRYGDGTARTTHEQNLLLRFVRHDLTADLFSHLVAARLAEAGAGTLADVTSCPGAESCRLAVTHSRGLGRLLRERLAARPDLTALAGELDVKISGCPNGCGQHHVAGIGLQGSVRQVGGRAVPQYFVLLGGGVAEAAQFARLAAKVPARRVPEAVLRLLALYASARSAGEDARAFFARVSLDAVRQRLSDLEAFVADEADEEDYSDLDEPSPVSTGRDGSEDHSLQEPA